MAWVRSGTACAGAVAALAACSSSSFTPPSDVAGNWDGTMQYTTSSTSSNAGNSTTAQQNVSMKLQKSGDAVTGTYDPSSVGYFSAAGTLAITGVDSSSAFTGALTFEPSSNPDGCSGTIDVSGSGSGSSLTWTSTGVTSTCRSNIRSSVTIKVNRQ
jgi:hypothetical protein